MYVLALRLKWFPVIGSVSVKGIVMPALVLSLTLSAWYIRQVRAIVLREMEKGYIDGLMSRGLSTRSILFGHVLRNCMVPLVTLFGISIGNLMGGATIVESIFSWPGVGKLAVDSITARDYPMIQGYVVWMALIFLAINFLVDLSYRFLDPRIRKGA
jgi:peptide/nickel transport system permease protein